MSRNCNVHQYYLRYQLPWLAITACGGWIDRRLHEAFEVVSYWLLDDNLIEYVEVAINAVPCMSV